MTDHRSLHEALEVEEVRRHGAGELEYIVEKLQKSKTDIKYTLHARPTFYTLSGGITQAATANARRGMSAISELSKGGRG